MSKKGENRVSGKCKLSIRVKITKNRKVDQYQNWQSNFGIGNRILIYRYKLSNKINSKDSMSENFPNMEI